MLGAPFDSHFVPNRVGTHGCYECKTANGVEQTLHDLTNIGSDRMGHPKSVSSLARNFEVRGLSF
jgi:hypothetical protein